MAVKLRLMRMGKKNQPTYRLVAADARSPRNGRFIEILGNYNPRRDPSTVNIDVEKAVRWLRNGAQPTETVARLLEQVGAMRVVRGEASLEDVLPAESDEERGAAGGAATVASSSAGDAPGAAETGEEPVQTARVVPSDAAGAVEPVSAES